MNARRPIILIDMDSTFVDWKAGFYAAMDAVVAAQGVASPLPEPDQMLDWIITGSDSERDRIIDLAFSHPPLYEDLEPFPGAVEAVNEMQEFAEVFLCTAPDFRNENCLPGKISCVNRTLGSQWRKRTVFAPDKTIVFGDILLDDHPKITGVMPPVWDQILFDATWNRQVSLPRLTDWAQWRSVVGEVLERRGLSIS